MSEKKFISFQEASRNNHGFEGNLDSCASFSQIQTGAILRIAEAAEAMAKNYNQLINELEWCKRRLKEEQSAADRLNRSNSALRGHLTRLKKK